MTLVITISCRDGIVVGGDRLITRNINGIYSSIGSGRRKVIPLTQQRICVAYWGLATLNRIPMENHIMRVKRRVLRGGNFNINTFSSELFNYLLQLNPTSEMGCHISGYYNNQPQIRHIFHETWHPTRGSNFTFENSNIEYHNLPRGNRIQYPRRRNYFALFNGDNIAVNGLINYPQYITNNQLSIPFHQMSIVDAVGLLKLLFATTINMQNYVNIYQNRGRIVGNGIDIITIDTNSNINQVAKAKKNLKISLT